MNPQSALLWLWSKLSHASDRGGDRLQYRDRDAHHDDVQRSRDCERWSILSSAE